jgi:LuxR family transcriptional regulator, maltose regulon positive regulatory protein
VHGRVPIGMTSPANTAEPRETPRQPLPATRERVPAMQRLVPRGALFDLLSSAGPGQVVLLCAPAGSGKTVLLRSWSESLPAPDRVGCVSVERGEADAQHFWLSVVDALAGAIREKGLVERVGATPAFRAEGVVEPLLSALDGLEEPVVLVIDDLHELRAPEAFHLLEHALTRVPPKLQVVLSTRVNPGLGLHRLRLTGKLVEIRGDDLRFSLEETGRLLRAAGIALPETALARLHERTEGWAAGLRLAAISLAAHPDRERFVAEFSGSERTVAAYLLAEVLERQPAEVRDLLLRTSILDRVSGPLADVLTGGTGSEAILQQLEDANAFVTSVDAGRSWFRYHHLFADLLRLGLRRLAPATVKPLHRAAADWYQQHGDMVEAIRHAQAADDWPTAARMVADSYISLVFDGRAATLRALLQAFPQDAADTDPELALAFAKARLSDGLLEESGQYLAVAERRSATVAGERRPRFDLQLAETRLALARRRGDLPTVLETMGSLESALAAQRTSSLRLGNDLRAAALMNLGIAELWASRTEDASRHLEQALVLARRIGRPYLQLGCLGHLAIAAPLLGRPAAVALELSEQAVALAREHGWTEDPINAAGLGCGAVVLVWLGRFEEAERSLEQARRAVRPEGEPGTELMLHHATGLLSMARRRFDDALIAFAAAKRMQTLLAGEHLFSGERRSRILQMQAWRGDLAAAHRTLAEMGGEQRDRAGARIAQATLHLAEGAPQRAVDVLVPVIERRERSVKATWAAIDASLLDALARDRLGDRSGAEASIERALELGEPEGVLLPFVLFPVRELLERHPRHRTAHATLLAASLDVLSGATHRHSAAAVREELSEAELRVVRYLPSNLKAREIASELYVSSNTVRTHLRHIYAKLDAHNRTEAVARARELGLLGPARVPH